MSQRKAKQVRQQMRAQAPPGAKKSTKRRRPGIAAGHSVWAWAVVALAAAAVVVGALAVVGRGGGSVKSAGTFHSKGGPLSSSAGDASRALGAIQRVSDAPLVEAGKPVVFFMGGQFCPFCAADRWAFVKATSRFGTWTNLRSLQSQGGVDGFASLPTYNLAGARYRSDLISLRHKEVADVSGNKLESLDSLENGLVNSYDPGGSIPFTVAGGSGGQYTVGLAFSPGLLKGQSFDKLRQALATGVRNPTVKAIDAEGDAITALLCKLTGGKPAAVCSAASITALQNQLS